ncbi:MAG: hypothetical protein HC853_01995 [Anaerolineae bacterium]|nr:hypothetical protein [Anaerolineae bacterium]
MISLLLSSAIVPVRQPIAEASCALSLARFALALLCDLTCFYSQLISMLVKMTFDQVLCAEQGWIQLPIEDAVIGIPVSAAVAPLAMGFALAGLRGRGKGRNRLASYCISDSIVNPTQQRRVTQYACRSADAILNVACRKADLSGIHLSHFVTLAKTHAAREPNIGPVRAAALANEIRFNPLAILAN